MEKIKGIYKDFATAESCGKAVYRVYAIKSARKFYDFYINKIGYGDLKHCFGIEVDNELEVKDYMYVVIDEYKGICDDD